MAQSVTQLNLYKIDQMEIPGEGGGSVYRVSEEFPLRNDGSNYATQSSIQIEEGSLWAVATMTPRLYPSKDDGKYDYAVAPAISDLGGDIDIFTDANIDKTTATIYRAKKAAAGTMIFKPISQSTAAYSLADRVYFNYVGGLSGLTYKTERSVEMYTVDGVTYRLDRVDLPKDQRFNISTSNDFSSTLQLNGVEPGTTNELSSSKYYYATSQMIGSVSAKRLKETYTTTLAPAYPAPVFLAVTENSNTAKTISYVEFEPNEDRSLYDYEYVAYLPSITGGDKTDQAMVVSNRLPVKGEGMNGLFSGGKVDISTEMITVEFDEEILPIGFSSSKRYVFTGGNFHGKVYVKTKKDNDGATISGEWDGIVVRSRSANDIMNEFASNHDLLDKLVNGTDPLRYSTKPILHDNPAYKDQTSISVPNKNNEGATDHDLVYMERRRTLTGVDCNINRVAAGGLASVVNIQDNLGNILSDDLSANAEFVSVANVKLTTAPLVSVRDEKHYFARGTEAGFNLASGSSSNVLSLSVIETLSLAFCRDGKIMAIVPASSKSGNGVDLSLISISSGGGSYNLKAVSPVVFDEICIFNSGGLKLEVGNALKVNYAFVGSEANSEIRLSKEGRAAYNAVVNGRQGSDDYELYVHSYSTPANINGGTVKAGSDGKGNFVGKETESENLTNLLSLGTLGMGWAEMKLDAVGTGAAADHEQLFPAGSRVNFVISSTKVLNLGVGTGNTITFFTRKNVRRETDGSIKSIEWDASHKYVLSATVLQLGVVSVAGEQVVSMVAPCDFSGVRLDINDGLVNVGGTNIYYASVTPPPYSPHKCQLGIPSKIFLDKTQVIYYDENGTVIPEDTEYVDTEEYTPAWDTSVAARLEWSFDTDSDGQTRIPQGSSATIDPQTGEISNIDMDGEYVVRYAVPGHDTCIETVTYVVDRKRYEDAYDDEIRNIIGDGLVIQNKRGEDAAYALSLDSHGISTGELLQIKDALDNPDNVLDGRFSTYATVAKGLAVAQNNIILGVKALNGEHFGTDNGAGRLKYPVRIGFVVEDNVTGLGVKALNYLQMRLYDKSGEADDVYRALIEENATVGLDLIGQKTVAKKRYSILVPAGTLLFNEFSLWNCGVADIDLNEIRIYGSFVEEVDPDNVNQNWAVGNHSDIICKDATATPMNVSVVNAASAVLKNLDFIIDDDLDTAFELGNGAGVGQGQKIRIELGRVVQPTEKIGIITGNKYDVADIEAGNWMTIRFYGPDKTAAANATNAPARVASSTTAHTEVTDWEVLGADVVGHGDRKGLYFVPTAPVAALELELGKIATVANNNGIYGITVAPAVANNVKFVEKVTPSGIEDTSADRGDCCTVAIDAAGVATITAPTCISDIRVYLPDGKLSNALHNVGGETASIQLTRGINLIYVTLADGHAATVKALVK